MIPCKNCKGVGITKNGTARGHQRYKCKDCNYNFVFGDKRPLLNESMQCMQISPFPKF